MDFILNDVLGLNESIKQEKDLEIISPLKSVFLANQKDVGINSKESFISFRVGNSEKIMALTDAQHNYLQNTGFPGRKWDDVKPELTEKVKSKLPDFIVGKRTYFPLIRINKEEYYSEIEELLFKYVSQNIMKISDSDFRSLLESVFGELIANIRQHSNYSNLFLFCQKWNNSLQIAILDDGIGFKGSLDKEDEAEALDLAVYKGISRKKEENGRGYGLQHLKASVLNDEVKGEFCAISNKDYIHFGDNGLKKGKLDFSCNGVLICLGFKNLGTADFRKAYETTLEPRPFLREKGYYLNPSRPF